MAIVKTQAASTLKAITAVAGAARLGVNSWR